MVPILGTCKSYLHLKYSLMILISKFLMNKFRVYSINKTKNCKSYLSSILSNHSQPFEFNILIYFRFIIKFITHFFFFFHKVRLFIEKCKINQIYYINPIVVLIVI